MDVRYSDNNIALNNCITFKIILILFFLPLYAYGWKGHPLLTKLLIKTHNIKFKTSYVKAPSFPLHIQDIKPFNTELCHNTFTEEIVSPDVLIINHSIDPDCGLDEDIEGGLIQKFMGGSQGYRHLYYPSWTLKFPLLFLPQGMAPFRAEKFFRLAEENYKRGNIPEGLLFTAWALHYIEDLSQPYHTCQTSWDFIKGAFTISAMTRYTKNFHNAYEDAVYLLINEELNGERNYGLIESLKHPVEVNGEDIKSLAINTAEMSAKLCRHLFRVSYLLWGKKLKVKEAVRLKPEEVLGVEDREEFKELIELTKGALKILSGSFLKYMLIISEISGNYIYISE